MKLFFGGVRGTGPVADLGFLEFGGETTALLVEGLAGEKIVLDAGTGLRLVNARLGAGAPGAPIQLLMTHYHLDHLMGLPSFGPLYNKLWAVEFAAPLREGVAAEDAVRRVLAKPFWPVQLEKLHARLSFTTLPAQAGQPVRRGALDIRWCAVHHPEGCHAYRLDEPATGASLVFATDMEWALATPAEQRDFLNLCRHPRPAHLLVMDGQFNRAHYAKFKGWGHSTWEDCVDVARTAQVRRLLITHHAPQNDDSLLLDVERAVQRALPGAGLARGGLEAGFDE
ncbi:MAG: MBL fold metallo-hydrolase [Kiritimatiellaeota bacterium]|nr:MBL fold metallo-hydrolase [Kiritimatiellota bacterium]